MLFRSNDTATTEIYTLSLHDALPIYSGGAGQYAYWDENDNPNVSAWSNYSGGEYLTLGVDGRAAPSCSETFAITGNAAVPEPAVSRCSPQVFSVSQSCFDAETPVQRAWRNSLSSAGRKPIAISQPPSQKSRKSLTLFMRLDTMNYPQQGFHQK